MKIDFPINSTSYTEYCVKCHLANKLEQQKINGTTQYKCSSCNASEPRAIIIDPQIEYWIDKDDEYCHKSVGVFIFNSESKILVFRLSKYPFGWTIPAGHIDKNEAPLHAVKREAREESDLNITQVKHISAISIDKDGCRRGADRHYWEVYCARADSDAPRIDVNEGSEYRWLGLDQLSELQKTPALEFILSQVAERIKSYLED